MAPRPAGIAALTVGAAALVAIGAGTGAVAATQITGAQIKDNTVTSADIKDETLKSVDIRNRTIRKGDIANGVLPRGYTVYDDSFVNLPSGAGLTTVLELPLPKGTYLVTATGGVNNNGGEVDYPITCTVVAGATSVDMGTNFAFGANGAVGETQWAAGTTVATLPSAGTARIQCSRTGGWGGGNFVRPSISAVSVQPGQPVVLSSSSAGDEDPNG
jgi:hypothetical protein